jgi:hypothetical protein
MAISSCVLRDVASQLHNDDLVTLATLNGAIHYQVIPELKKRHFLHAFVECEDLDMCIWILTNTNLNIHEHAYIALEMAAIEGNIVLCKWLVDNCAKLSVVGVPHFVSLANAAVHGHLALCKWLVTHFKLTFDNVRHSAFYQACFHGQLDVLKWFVEYFELSSRACDVAFREASDGGHLEMCKWIVSKINITVDDYLPTIVESLGFAAKGGHLHICEWLVGHYGLTLDHVTMHYSEPIRYAAIGGHLDICKWFVGQFGIGILNNGFDHGLMFVSMFRHLHICQWVMFNCFKDAQEDRDRLYWMLLNAVGKGNLDVCQWLVSEHGITKEDIARNNNALFIRACQIGYLVLSQWLVVKFGLDRNVLTAAMDDCDHQTHVGHWLARITS